jgi:hypothetical protein
VMVAQKGPSQQAAKPKARDRHITAVRPTLAVPA